MTWIESHQELREHPKTKRCARLLGIGTPQMVGHLQFLWWWCLDYAEDGDLSRYDAFDIADAAGWEGDASEFVDALMNCGPGDGYGFLNTDLAVHDWNEYAGRLLEQRQFNRERQTRRRSLYNDSSLTRAVKVRDGDHCRYCGLVVNWNDRRSAGGGTYDHVNPDGDNSVENIVVACRACNSRKGRLTPDEAGMALLPIPTATADNRQVPDKTPTDSSAITLPDPTLPDKTEPGRKNPPVVPPSGDTEGDAPRKPARERERDPLFEAIAEAWKGEPYRDGLLTRSQSSLVGTAVAEIRKVKGRPEEVPREWTSLRERFDNPTPAALAKHWGTNGTGPKHEQSTDPIANARRLIERKRESTRPDRDAGSVHDRPARDERGRDRTLGRDVPQLPDG